MKVHEFRKFQEHFLYKYFVSFTIIFIAALIQDLLWDYIDPSPYLIFYPAIIFACLYGHGTTAIILSMIFIQYRFIDPYNDLGFLYPQDYIRQLVFLLSTVAIRILVRKVIVAKFEAESAVESMQEEKELREKFVSTLTHDLQTPITAMKLATGLLLKVRNDPEAQNNFAFKISSNMTRIENMVRDLLDANQIRAGKSLPVEIAYMNLSQVVDEVITELTSIHGNRFKLIQDREVKGYWCAESIRRILENLCTNAIKYGKEERPVTIRVETDNNEIRILIHNEGPPIPEEDQRLLFDSFERGRSVRSTGKKGWGLGLTLVKALSESMGGHAQVESNHEIGTLFTVTLPRNARKNIPEDDLSDKDSHQKSSFFRSNIKDEHKSL
jgi:signal transduction histidine kinase